MITTQQIKTHLDKRHMETPSIEAIQGETMRAVEFLLYNNGTEWTIPEGTAVTIHHRIFHEGHYYGSTYDTLPDGTPAYSINGHMLTVYLTTEVLSIWGVGELQIGLFNNGAATALFSVLLRVQQDFSYDGTAPEVYHNVSTQIHSAINQWADRNIGGGFITTNELRSFQEETKTFIIEELAKNGQLKPEFASSIDGCTDTSKLYVLPDGCIYAYMTKETATPPKELYTPQNATLNKRFSGTPGSEVAGNGYYITDFAELDLSDLSSPCLLDVSGFYQADAGNPQMTKIAYYDADKAILGTVAVNTGSIKMTANETSLQIYAGYGPSDKLNYYNSIRYIRFNNYVTGAALTTEDIPTTVSISVNGSGGTLSQTEWHSTGHAFVPADYESRIIALEEQTAALKSTESKSSAVPPYWKEAVDTAVAKVKVLQDQGGSDVVNFLWFSDMHYAAGSQSVENLGTLCATVMDECHIPLAVSSGDTMSAGIASTEDQLLSWLSGAMNVLAPIGPERLLIARGNHDDVYGSYTNGSTTSYYVNKVGADQVWNVLHRAQAMDFQRVLGGNGTYFYLDNLPQKVRFVCLNSHYYDGKGYANGTTSAMTAGFGTEQLAWLRDTALAVGDGWSVVIVTHVPPTAQAVNGNTYYLSQLPDGENFRTIIKETAANLIGIFCGHCHADTIVPDDLPCPIITVTCAINTPYDGTAADRVPGTSAETALDIVSINKATRTIHLTRLGAGMDRTSTY